MRWANFLHVYQPAEQQPAILEAVIAQSYRPLLEGCRTRPHTRLTLNVTGALLELFDRYGHRDLIDMLREMGTSGMVEFTGSAKYHAFLPLLEEDEIVRQIRINNETLEFFLGGAYRPRGFFPPEMGYHPGLDAVIKQEGFAWLLLDEISLTGSPEAVDWRKTYRIRGSELPVFFRERRISNLIMSAIVRSGDSFRQAIAGDLDSDRYVITGMDGETFGHHRPGLEKTLFEIMDSPDLKQVFISDLLAMYPEVAEASPIASTWASSPNDIHQGIQFLSWSDPTNAIHGHQWELVRLALGLAHGMDPSTPGYEEIRRKMDIALASDHFWWASAKPWWSVEMIEDGAYRLLDAVRSVPGASAAETGRAAELYEKIVSTAFQWQRSGRIHELMREQKALLRIPFRERTLGQGGPEEGVFHAFLDMMRKLEKESAARGEYEQSVLWRDASYKLEHGNDIYDTLNVIDLLRLKIPHEEVERTIAEYKEEFKRIRGGQPEQRGS